MSSIYIDLIITILLVFGFLIGFKRGFTRQLVSLLVIVMALLLSFFLKRPLAIFLAGRFPIIKVRALNEINILLYEVVAFSLIFFLLSVISRILILITNLFEKILKVTVILSIPSKLLGGLLGLIENYILIFVILSFINLPIFNLNINSSFSKFIIADTPLIKNINFNKDDLEKKLEEYRDIDKKTDELLKNLNK